MEFAGGSPLGISVKSPRIDIDKTVHWKDSIVAKFTGGVGALFKKHKVTVVKGGPDVDGKTVEVKTADRTVTISCRICCWLPVPCRWRCRTCRLAGA